MKNEDSVAIWFRVFPERGSERGGFGKLGNGVLRLERKKILPGGTNQIVVLGG